MKSENAPIDSSIFLMKLHNSLGNSAWVGTFQTETQLINQVRGEIVEHLKTHGIHPTTKEEADQPVTDDQCEAYRRAKQQGLSVEETYPDW